MTTFRSTTFRSSITSTQLRAPVSGRHSGPVTVAQLASTVTDGPLPFRLTAFDGSEAGPPDTPGLHIRNHRALTYLLTAPGDLGLARAYIAGDMDLTGVHPADPYALLRLMDDELRLHRPSPGQIAELVRGVGLKTLLPVPPPPQEAIPRWLRIAHGLGHTRRRDSSAIGKHYDVSNAFYESVLGPSMTYTCALYPTADTTLDQAQQAKLTLVFDKLGLQPGDRLLDVGCGWGSMVRHAARRGVRALGVTLSREQAEWGRRAVQEEGLAELAEIRHLDYRDVPETGFDAVSSIGLTEHIGVRHYPDYFGRLYGKLRPGGRLLNHCITRPQNNTAAKADAFIDRYVFPDGELTGSGRVIVAMQDAGFDVRHAENLREHYAMTLRDWCANLERDWDACVADVGEGTAKVWGLYMAACRLGFERNNIQLFQVLGIKPGDKGNSSVPLRPWWSG